MRRKLNVVAFLVSIFATLLSVYSMAGSVRSVDIITLFFSGVIVGITTLNFIKRKKTSDTKE
ncbi:MAG: hypothetical protein KJ571_03775 [Bacteroidetes bacterium]|nr:hypothetical protein [Bacteroidota bacterium]